MSSSAETTPNTATQAKGAALRIAVAAVGLAGIFFVYSSYVDTSKKLTALHKDVLELIKHDNPADYLSATDKLEKGLALREEDWFIAERAEVAALLWVEGGIESHKAAALTYFQKAADRKINTGPRFNAEALTMIGQGQIDKAEGRLVDVVSKTAATAGMIADLGIVHEREGKLETAKSDFKQAADRDWINPRFGTHYGEALFDNAEYGQAQSAFLKSLEGNPNHIGALIGKARSDIALNVRLTEASKTLDDILAGPANSLSPVLKSHALVGRAEVLLAQGDSAKAEAAAREAIAAKVEGDSSLGYAQYDLGLALAKQKKAGALDAFNSAIASVAYIPHFYFEGALALVRAGQKKEAGALLDKYLARITDASGKLKVDDAYHRAKGEYLTLTDDLDGALKEYDLAIGDNPLNADAYYQKGMIFKQKAATASKATKTDVFNQAITSFGAAIAHKERYPEAYLETGMIYIEMNPKDDRIMEKFGKALVYYKDAHAPKAVTDAFISRVEQTYLKLGKKFKKTAADWVHDATQLLKP